MLKFKDLEGQNASLRMTKKFVLKKSTENTIIGISLLLISLGSLFNIYWDRLFDYAFNKQVVLSESSFTYDFWLTPPLTVHHNIYFFNWTNPSDLKQPGYKPNFVELGPYVFEMKSKKVDMVWNENGTVTYRHLRRWYFVEELSNGTYDDVITTINILPVGAAYYIRNWSMLARKSFSIVLGTTQSMHISKKVREYTFEGYKDPLISAASITPVFSRILPQDRGGYFYIMNNSADYLGVINMETGANGLDKIGKVRSWNYVNSTRFYDKPCGSVKGSAGELWSPNQGKDKDLHIFMPDICRYMTFRYSKEVLVEGVKGNRYDLVELWDNGTTNPENKCFCGSECFPSGVLDLSKCFYGAPAFGSSPHFYQADSYYRDSITGMKPEAEKHETYLVLEPTYGLVLEVAGRLQGNVMVQEDPYVRMLNKVPRLFFPVLWAEQKSRLPSNLIMLVKIVLIAPSLAVFFSIAMIIIGISMLALAFSSKLMRLQYNTISSSSSNMRCNKRDTFCRRDTISPLVNPGLVPELVISQRQNSKDTNM